MGHILCIWEFLLCKCVSHFGFKRKCSRCNPAVSVNSYTSYIHSTVKCTNYCPVHPTAPSWDVNISHLVLRRLHCDLVRQWADGTNRLPLHTRAVECDVLLSVCGVLPEITHWLFSGVVCKLFVC